MGITAYALAVVGVLAVASCLALGIGLALNPSGRSREHSGHTPGGRVLPAPASGGGWGEIEAAVEAASNTSPADEPAVEVRRRPLTADQQATRDAWARWRAERSGDGSGHDSPGE